MAYLQCWHLGYGAQDPILDELADSQWRERKNVRQGPRGILYCLVLTVQHFPPHEAVHSVSDKSKYLPSQKCSYVLPKEMVAFKVFPANLGEYVRGTVFILTVQKLHELEVKMQKHSVNSVKKKYVSRSR